MGSSSVKTPPVDPRAMPGSEQGSRSGRAFVNVEWRLKSSALRHRWKRAGTWALCVEGVCRQMSHPLDPPPISRAEVLARQELARAAAQLAGYDALLVIGRSFYDRP